MYLQTKILTFWPSTPNTWAYTWGINNDRSQECNIIYFQWMITLYNFWQANACYSHASILLTLELNFEFISSNICRWQLTLNLNMSLPLSNNWALKFKNKCSTQCYCDQKEFIGFLKGPPLFCRDHIKGTKWGLGPFGGGGGVQSSYLPALKACFSGGAGFFMPEAFYMGSHCFFCVDIK